MTKRPKKDPTTQGKHRVLSGQGGPNLPIVSAAPSPGISSTDGLAVRDLVPVVDALWKAQSRWERSNGEEVSGPLRHMGRNLEYGLENLRKIRFEIKDHTGDPYIDGLRVEVLAFQPVEKLISRVIIETLKPTIYFNNHLIRAGQVIVGVPIEEQP